MHANSMTAQDYSQWLVTCGENATFVYHGNLGSAQLWHGHMPESRNWLYRDHTMLQCCLFGMRKTYMTMLDATHSGYMDIVFPCKVLDAELQDKFHCAASLL